jgi:lysophospholipase L1-like esterase
MRNKKVNKFWLVSVLAMQRSIAAMRHSIEERRLRRLLSAKVIAAVVGLASLAAIPVSLGAQEQWAGTWAAGPTGPLAPADGGPTQYENQTLRLIVHTSIGGSQVRVRVSNTFGDQSLVIGAAHVAVRQTGARIVPNTDRALTFSGMSSFTVPAGALVISDPVDLGVPALSDLAVSIYLPALSTANTTHVVGLQTNYVAQNAGDFTAAPDLPGATTTFAWDFLTGVDVTDEGPAAAIVALGDSITDGLGSTPDTNQRWPNFLAARLQARSGFDQVGVLNEGIIGNRILHPAPVDNVVFGPAALARFDRDVLGQTGLKFLIVLLGTNDIALPGIAAPASEEVSAHDVIAGHLQLITRAHERGIVVYGCTLIPFEDSTIAPGFWSPEKEVKRQAVNRWIRTSGAYDAVIDFDKAIRDPAHTPRILPAYDSGDHTHPNDAGYNAMAQAIDLNLFPINDLHELK